MFNLRRAEAAGGDEVNWGTRNLFRALSAAGFVLCLFTFLSPEGHEYRGSIALSASGFAFWYVILEEKP